MVVVPGQGAVLGVLRVGLGEGEQLLGDLVVVGDRRLVAGMARQLRGQAQQLAPRVAPAQPVEQVEPELGVQVVLELVAVPIDQIDRAG